MPITDQQILNSYIRRDKSLYNYYIAQNKKVRERYDSQVKQTLDFTMYKLKIRYSELVKHVQKQFVNYLNKTFNI